MIDYMTKQLEAGKDVVTIHISGAIGMSQKVKVESFDALGIVARVKGMMGGFGEPIIFPWSCIAMLSWD